MASRRARSRKEAEAAKWVAWSVDDPEPWRMPEDDDEMDVSEDEQYEPRFDGRGD